MTKMDMTWIGVALLLYPKTDPSRTVSRFDIGLKVRNVFQTSITPAMINSHLVNSIDRQADKANPQRGGSRNRYLVKSPALRDALDYISRAIGHQMLGKRLDLPVLMNQTWTKNTNISYSGTRMSMWAADDMSPNQVMNFAPSAPDTAYGRAGYERR